VRHFLVADIGDDLALVGDATLLALVTIFSAMGRRALALASVVTRPSAAISDATRLPIINFWWAASPPNRRLLRGVPGMPPPSPP